MYNLILDVCGAIYFYTLLGIKLAFWLAWGYMICLLFVFEVISFLFQTCNTILNMNYQGDRFFPNPKLFIIMAIFINKITFTVGTLLYLIVLAWLYFKGFNDISDIAFGPSYDPMDFI